MEWLSTALDALLHLHILYHNHISCGRPECILASDDAEYSTDGLAQGSRQGDFSAIAERLLAEAEERGIHAKDVPVGICEVEAYDDIATGGRRE